MKKYRQPITLSAVLLGVLAIVFSLHSFTGNYKGAMQITGQGQQLLDQSWDNLPGTQWSASSLTVSNRNWAVRTLQDTYLANPPALLYGKHIETQGDISLEYKISNRVSTASILLFSKPPFIMDEQILKYPYLEISINDTQATVKSWLQNTDQPTFTKSVARPNIKNATITVNRTNGLVSVDIDGSTIQVSSNPLQGKQLWFGANAPTNDGSWQLDSVIAKALNGDLAEIIDTRELTFNQTNTGLQDTASAQRTDFKIGAAISLMPAVSDANYGQSAFGGDFGMFTTENALKMQFVQPKRGVYDFAEAEGVVGLAKKHAIDVHGHALVFGEANPQWLGSVPKNEVEAVMLDHIKTTVSHFKDSIQSWDVVNEPLANYDEFTSSAPLRNHVWMQGIGSSYIEKALRAAHAANPTAQLWINDFGLEGSPSDGGDTERWDAMLKLVTDLKAKGVPLTGLGFQGHMYQKGDEITPRVFESRLVQLEKLGLKARVSELDVHTEDGLDGQAQYAAEIVKACFTHTNCTSVSTWGVNDAYGSTGSVEGSSFSAGDGLLWDVRNAKVPAYESVKKALQDAGAAVNHTTPTPIATPTALTPSPTATPLPSPTISALPTNKPTSTPSPIPSSTPSIPSLTVTEDTKPTPIAVRDNTQPSQSSANAHNVLSHNHNQHNNYVHNSQNTLRTQESTQQPESSPETKRSSSGRFNWFWRFVRWFNNRSNN